MNNAMIKYDAAVVLHVEPAVTLHVEPAGFDEDLVRKSLIDALALMKNQYTGHWFKIPHTAQMFILNAERHINDHLNALLRGTYPALIAKEAEEGRERLKNMCL